MGKESTEKKAPAYKGEKKKYYDALMKLREEYMGQLSFHKSEALDHSKDSAGDRAGMATHMADLGSDNSLHEMELSLMSEEVDVIEMIDEALDRLKHDEYGICQDCGKNIAPERLEIKPHARFCVRCKSNRESRGHKNR